MEESLVGRLDRMSSFRLHYPDESTKVQLRTTPKSGLERVRKGNPVEADNREASSLQEAAEDDKDYDNLDSFNEKALQLESSSSSPEASGPNKSKGDSTKAGIRGREKDIVDAVMCFSETAKEAADMQWKQWCAEQKEIALDREAKREIEKQKLELERDRLEKEIEQRNKDREADLQKHLATVKALENVMDRCLSRNNEKT
ncbi:uncharacterized protein LOC129589567 [Paramacrobiotus metropolitanus]|uniref:uncharacterized protein LOC129589567 n=1 Tax=Paramacrobiotus metropolitanus TaxID=2943436 RepID=UPI0024461F11|nr:uncharacterized protein LOC129589567 [Paramacrobiotus metropolitanus]